MTSLYLDYNATTPLSPGVAEAMRECDARGYLNPESQHQFGQLARRRLEVAREAVARRVGARCGSHQADRVIFTSGGTEANNLALLGLAGETPGQVLVSAIEHPSVLGGAEHLERRGWMVERLPVTREGVVELDALRAALRPETRLVSVMLVNNETGVVQPVREIAEICAAVGVPVHTDAVQAMGKIPVDFAALGVTAMTLTAHKFYGPRGVGALVVKHAATLRPILFGGFQQAGVRPGTESVTLAVGLQAALEEAAGVDVKAAELRGLRDRFEQRLREALPNLEIHGTGAERAPHTSNVAFLGVDRQVLAVALDLAGVACSTGSACASGSTDPSHVLVAMGLPEAHLRSSLRFSFGSPLSLAEVDLACERIAKTVKDLRARANVRKD
jgi:cysteine desulfurase